VPLTNSLRVRVYERCEFLLILTDTLKFSDVEPTSARLISMRVSGSPGRLIRNTAPSARIILNLASTALHEAR
jgi:hypothetical protein